MPLKSLTLNGYVVPGTCNARWRESPLWPLYLSYLVLYVDADYQTALIGYPGRGYGWVFARKPVIDDATYQSLLTRATTSANSAASCKRQIKSEVPASNSSLSRSMPTGRGPDSVDRPRPEA